MNILKRTELQSEAVAVSQGNGSCFAWAGGEGVRLE